MAQVEVELRGPLSRQEFTRISGIMKKEAIRKKDKKRLSLMYFRGRIPRDIKEIKDEKVDLRLRITNKLPELVMKHGTFEASNSRKEFSFELQQGKFIEMIEFLKYLGWKKCVAYATETKTYLWKGIEFAIVEIKGFGFMFEAELLTTERYAEEAKERISKECRSLGLSVYSSKEFDAQCNAINNTRALQYDFDKMKTEAIKEQFQEHF